RVAPHRPFHSQRRGNRQLSQFKGLKRDSQAKNLPWNQGLRGGAIMGLSAPFSWRARSARYNRRHKITLDGTSGTLVSRASIATFAHREHPCFMNAPVFTLAISSVGGCCWPCY